MKINENNFFRQATLRICQHLDIEKAMSSCLKYLVPFMPADMMFLELYEWDLGAMRLIARATAAESEKLDLLIPFSPEASDSFKKYSALLEKSILPEVLIFNRPELDPASRSVLEFLDEHDKSALVMVLLSDGKILGHLVLVADGNDRYTDEHARLLSLLKEPFNIAMSNTLEHRKVLHLKDALADDNRYLHRELHRLSGYDIVGSDFGLKDVMEMVRQVAPLDSPVLLLGETGVGKEVVAHAIHYSSPRNEGPFIAVNSGAIPDTLIDSELFGHEKGAFTGAVSQKRGRFERAEQGTIFLDEIGELPLQAQVRLLRVLEEKKIERVGGTSTITVDVRIIAATHRNLEEMVKSNHFREDLWFRLNVFPIKIPPLRARKDDIPALVGHFIEKKSRDLKFSKIPTLAPEAMDRLMAYNWPGNVRELENVVERALIMHKGGSLMFDLLQPAPKEDENGASPEARFHQENEPLILDEVVAKHIRRVLKMTGGKVHGPGGAAELMGINPSTLRNRMNKLGIPYGRGG